MKLRFLAQDCGERVGLEYACRGGSQRLIFFSPTCEGLLARFAVEGFQRTRPEGRGRHANIRLKGPWGDRGCRLALDVCTQRVDYHLQVRSRAMDGDGVGAWGSWTSCRALQGDEGGRVRDGAGYWLQTGRELLVRSLLAVPCLMSRAFFGDHNRGLPYAYRPFDPKHGMVGSHSQGRRLRAKDARVSLRHCSLSAPEDGSS